MPIKIYLYDSSTADIYIYMYIYNIYIYIYACTVRKSRHNNHKVINVQLKNMINMFSTECSIL